jgi:hypothetical protein
VTLRQIIVPAAVICIAAVASANTTAFNGYVQSSGGGGLDLTSLDGGSYRVTVTRSGQLNFRYMMGDQTFDSNPEAALFHLEATTSGSGNGSGSAIYKGYATLSVENPTMYNLANYSSSFVMTSSSDPSQFLSAASFDPPSDGSGGSSGNGWYTYPTAAPQFSFQSDSVAASGFVNGPNFDISSLVPVVQELPGTSVAAYVINAGEFVYYTPISGLEAPEPGTLVLMAGALLAGAGAIALRRALRATRPQE